MQQPTFRKAAHFIDAGREQVIAWQRNLVSIPAMAPESGGNGEGAKAEYVMGILKELGADEIRSLSSAGCARTGQRASQYFGALVRRRQG